MRRRLCAKCGIANFYLKGCDSRVGEILPIYVTSDGVIIPKREGDSLVGFNTETIYCLGCSWSGSLAMVMRGGFRG
ncbi:MAG: hypothetical protein R3Y22_01350 [Bacteroidales bacterium]